MTSVIAVYWQQNCLRWRKFVHTNLPQSGFVLGSLGAQVGVQMSHPYLFIITNWLFQERCQTKIWGSDKPDAHPKPSTFWMVPNRGSKTGRTQELGTDQKQENNGAASRLSESGQSLWRNHVSGHFGDKLRYFR